MRLFLISIFILLICLPCYAQPIAGAIKSITTEDGATVVYPWQVKVTNGALTDNADGTASLTTGGTDEVGAVTNGKWCVGDGTYVQCSEAAPAGTGDVTSVGDCADGACFAGASGTTFTFNHKDGDKTFGYDGVDFDIQDDLIVAGSLTTTGDITVSGDTVTFGGNAEYVDNSSDGLIEFQGVGGVDNTDIRLDLDGTGPTWLSPTDSVISFNDSVTLFTGKNFTIGTTQWNTSDTIDGEQIANDTIDDDSIDFADVTAADITFAEGDITDSTIVSADIKDGTVTIADTAITAGRSLTASTNDILADAELYTDTKCIYIEDPTADDDLKSIWLSRVASTLTAIWAESDQTVTFMLQVDDGSAADCDSVDLAPAAGVAEDTALDGDATMAAGDRLDLAVTSVANTPTWCSICWTVAYDD